MNRFSRSLLLLALLSAAPASLFAEDFPLREAVECHPRAGLPNLQAKIKANQSIKIAYLGGSITAAPGWRVQSLAWFQQQHPSAAFQEIHAAIGGTGSDLGVFRLHNDVLRHQPDLLFVEFAVNDGGAAPEQIHKAMEGIVRQTWKADSTIDICFVYTVSLPIMPDLHAGKMQRSASAMEALADLYQIPSIHFGIEVARLEKAGDLLFKAEKPADLATSKPMVFSTDGVHPHVETGHQLYTAAIARSWPAITAASQAPGPHLLPKPLRADNWEAAKQVPITTAMLKGDWKTLPADHQLAARFARNMPTLHQAIQVGASLEFKFRGHNAAVFDIVGPDGGKLKIEVNDSPPKTANRVDGYCTYHRMSKLQILSTAPTTGESIHHVRISLSADTLDKRDILFESNRPKFDANPEPYQAHTWFASSLLIIGDLVE